MSSPNVWRVVALALVFASALPGAMRAQSAVEDIARRAASAKLRPGDRIELQFRRDRELNASIGVNERGEAVFPKLGTLDVAEMTIAQLQDSLRTGYGTYLRYPEFEVSVLRRVTVNGEVKVPNVYLMDLTSSVRDAIARAGGAIETANRNRVYIIRNGERLRVKDWDRKEGPQFDLVSGDQILVGRKSWLTLNALPLVSTSVIVIGLIRSLKN
jgi:polysaccharide biosynthesis/export protein VpsN